VFNDKTNRGNYISLTYRPPKASLNVELWEVNLLYVIAGFGK
jgi:hypothetical protein